MIGVFRPLLSVAVNAICLTMHACRDYLTGVVWIVFQSSNGDIVTGLMRDLTTCFMSDRDLFSRSVFAVNRLSWEVAIGKLLSFLAQKILVAMSQG